MTEREQPSAPDADVLEDLRVLARMPHERLPEAARARLGTRPGQVNLLLRMVVRPLDRTLTDHDANVLRDRVYAALHEGPQSEWAAGQTLQETSGSGR